MIFKTESFLPSRR